MSTARVGDVGKGRLDGLLPNDVRLTVLPLEWNCTKRDLRARYFATSSEQCALMSTPCTLASRTAKRVSNGIRFWK